MRGGSAYYGRSLRLLVATCIVIFVKFLYSSCARLQAAYQRANLLGVERAWKLCSMIDAEDGAVGGDIELNCMWALMTHQDPDTVVFVHYRNNTAIMIR